MRSPHPCSRPGCPELVIGRFCEKHTRQDIRQERQEYERYNRDPEMKAFFGSSAWRRTRAYKLSIDPLCEICKRQGISALYWHIFGTWLPKSEYEYNCNAFVFEYYQRSRTMLPFAEVDVYVPIIEK